MCIVSSKEDCGFSSLKSPKIWIACRHALYPPDVNDEDRSPTTPCLTPQADRGRSGEDASSSFTASRTVWMAASGI